MYRYFNFRGSREVNLTTLELRARLQTELEALNSQIMGTQIPKEQVRLETTGGHLVSPPAQAGFTRAHYSELCPVLNNRLSHPLQDDNPDLEKTLLIHMIM